MIKPAGSDAPVASSFVSSASSAGSVGSASGRRVQSGDASQQGTSNVNLLCVVVVLYGKVKLLVAQVKAT